MEPSEFQDQQTDDFCPNTQKDQKCKVSGLAPSYLYRKEKLKWSFRTHARDIACCTGCLGLFAAQATQRHTHCKWGPNPHGHNINPPSAVRQQGRRAIMPTISRRMRGLCSSMKQPQPQPQQANGMTQLHAWETNLFRNSNT
jgi:hypothetical protein